MDHITCGQSHTNHFTCGQHHITCGQHHTDHMTCSQHHHQAPLSASCVPHTAHTTSAQYQQQTHFSASPAHQTHLALAEERLDVVGLDGQHPVTVGDGQTILLQLQTAQGDVEEHPHQQLLLLTLLFVALQVAVLQDSRSLSTTHTQSQLRH